MKELMEKRMKALAEMRELSDKAKAEKRSLKGDDEASKRYAELEAEIRELDAQIEAEKREAELKGFDSALPVETEQKGKNPEEAFLRMENVDGKLELRTAMTLADGGAGIAPEKFVDELIKAIEKDAPLYARVQKIPVTGAGSLGLPYEDTDASGASWTAEVPDNDIGADSSWKFGKRSLAPIDLTKLIKFSKKLLSSSAMPIDDLAMQKIKDKLVAAFENAITNGNDSGQPLGIFTASNDGIPASRDVKTSGTSDVVTADDLISMKMKLRPGYRKNAVWIMSTSMLEAVMKLKDDNGQYIWHESFRAGEPSTLLGLPVIESEYAPSYVVGTTTKGSYIAALGDLSYYKFAYWKGLDVTIDNYTFAGKNQIGVYGHTLADGCPALAEAFVRLVYGTAAT